MTSFRPQASTVFKSLSNSISFPPLSLVKSNSGYGSNWLLSSLNNKFVKKSYFKTSPTKLAGNSGLNKNNTDESKAKAI